MIHVVVTLKGRMVGRFDVDGDVVRIGRHPDNEVQIDNRGVSRFHSLVRRDPRSGLWTVEDQGSHNGTFVNGARVKTKILRSGDAISVGQFTVSLQHDAEPGATPLASSPVSFRPSGRPGDREQKAPEKGYLEFVERSSQVLLTRDVCQLGSAPGLDVHLDDTPPKSVVIVRGYGGFQLVNCHPDQQVLVDDQAVSDRVWLRDGAFVRIQAEEFTFRQGLPAAELGTMEIEIPKNLRPPDTT